MEAVLDAIKPKKTLTNSKEDIRNLEVSENYVDETPFSLPELDDTVVINWKWVSPNTITKSATDAFYEAIETLDEIKNPAFSKVKKDVIDKIIAFRSLNENWDGYGAFPLEVKSASSAIQFILLLNDRIVEKISDVYPTPNGTVSLVWENDANERLALEIGNNTLSYYVVLNSQKPLFFNAIEINVKNAYTISTFIKSLQRN
jgi:hypothetical protein